MDVAASAISLIHFTIKGLKIIQETFSSMKDGPETVSYVIKNATHLLHILERLNSSPVVARSQDTTLSEMLNSCHADVTRMAQKLKSVDFKTSDGVRSKLWKSVKSVVQEKDWKEFQLRLHAHSCSLSTFITIEDSDKLFDMSDKMNTSHTLIQDQLLRLFDKCDAIEAKCDKFGAVAKNSELQGIINSVRQAIQYQLQPLLSQQAPSTSHVENSQDFQITRATEEMTSYPQNVAANNDPDRRVDQLSNLVKDNRDNIGVESDATLGILKDIMTIVDDLKSLTTQATALSMRTQPGHSLTGQQSHQTFVYREFRYTPDPLLSVPLQTQGYTETRNASLPAVAKDCYWSIDEVLANASILQDFFSHDRICLANTIARPAMVNRQTLVRLVHWSGAKPPLQMLWIKGNYTTARDLENNITRIGLKVINIAEKLRPHVPVISFFCQLGAWDILKPDETIETKALTSLLYALIWQLLQILSSQLLRGIELSESRFRSLDGRMGTWKAALAILEDLVGLITKPTYCILDGIQWLEHTSTQACLRELLRILRHKFLHVLFITSGSSVSLRDAISKDETVGDADLRNGAFKEDLEKHEQKFWQ